MANDIVVVFVKKIVMSIAEIPNTALAELCCTLRASSLSFHPFLAGDSEAADISDLYLFTGLEIRAQVWGCDRGRPRGRPCPGCSARLGFGSGLGLRSCLRLGFVLDFHGWVARAIGKAYDSQSLTMTVRNR